MYEDTLIRDNPSLIIKIARISAECNVMVPEYWFMACHNNLKSLSDKLNDEAHIERMWNELLWLVGTSKPSVGFLFLHDVGALKILLPELDDCFGVEQNQAYHKFDVFTHCLAACDNCEGNSLIKMAALLHDVGKPVTKVIRNGSITFHKHEVLSTKLVRNILNRFNVNQSDGLFILELVSNHMYQYDRIWKDSTVIRFIIRVGLFTSDYTLKDMKEFPLFQLRRADRSGRGLPPNTEKQNDFEERILSVYEKYKEQIITLYEETRGQ
jgi:tRNA nucleotidyltransferase (CCA-adding enzyme)